MVNNSTNFNHHSRTHKGGATPSNVGNAGHGLGQDKWIGSEKMHCNRVHEWPLQTIDACCEYDILHTQGTCLCSITWKC
jgi:hypothetical protein